MIDEILEDFCIRYRNFKIENPNPKKGASAKFFKDLVDLFYQKNVDYLNSLDIKDPRDFKSLISRNLKIRRDRKRIAKEKREELQNLEEDIFLPEHKAEEASLSDEEKYYSELGGGDVSLGKEFFYLYQYG